MEEDIRNLKSQFLLLKDFQRKRQIIGEQLNKKEDEHEEFLNSQVGKEVIDRETMERFNLELNKLRKENSSLYSEEIKCKEFIQKLYDDIPFCIEQLKHQMDKLNKPSQLYILAPGLKQTRDLKLPVFGQNQFNEKTVLIHKFVSKFTNFMSLKNPKKIAIQGNDGHTYSFILKNSEDLRSDQRIMIFFKFMNQVLRNKIKTYLVVPLTSRFGVIQFVKNMTEPIELIKFYRKKAEVVDNKIAGFYLNCEVNFLINNGPVLIQKRTKKSLHAKLTNIQHLEIFQEVLKKTSKRSTDLRESFWSFNSTSDSWLKFVKNYTISCALTSIVGYIIGIGDRHLKNIMISKKDGYLMHIDFCDTFEINQIRVRNPELFPFRLTRNMVDAFGPCKCNGTFRIYCEEVLEIIRKNREQIMSILNVFIASPVTSNFDQTKFLVSSESDISNVQKEMKFKMERVAKKVNGTDYAIILPKDYEIMDRFHGLSNDAEVNEISNIQPLSVQEQVSRLIEEATNVYNLANGFTGWEPWK